MTAEETQLIRAQAAELLEHLQADIRNAATRNEHIRLTQLTAEAERLLAAIDGVAAE